jgi:protein-ribulosamine 3-kinase
MTNPMEVLHVMTPAEWGKPIDVDEKWIHFVDENVKASKLRTNGFNERS